jgi:hypothetical protein
MLDQKEEKRFEELRGMCRELKVPAPPEIMIGLKVHDHNGVLTFDDIQRGHSWTRNYWNCLMLVGVLKSAATGSTYAAGSNSLRARNGSYDNPYPNDIMYAFTSGVGTPWNILVGTGDTAFSIDQYEMATFLASGTFVYNAFSGSSVTYTGVSKTWKNTASRIFNNNSGGSITIKEVGIATNQFHTLLIERSVLSPTVAVANGAQLTVTYEISMDFSAID